MSAAESPVLPFGRKPAACHFVGESPSHPTTYSRSPSSLEDLLCPWKVLSRHSRLWRARVDRVEIARSASSPTIRERLTARRPAPAAGQLRDTVGDDSCSCWLGPSHLSSRAIRFIIGRFVPPDDQNRRLRYHSPRHLIRRPSRLRSLDINIGWSMTSWRIGPKLETITPTDKRAVRNHWTADLMPQ